MKHTLYLLILALFLLPGTAAAQISPFDAMRWVEGQPEVKLDQRWYALLELQQHPIDDVLKAAEAQYGAGDVQKRVREDLIHVMALLGTELSQTIDLKLRDLETAETVQRKNVEMTREKRQTLLRAARNQQQAKRSAPLTGKQVADDLKQLKSLLQRQSSYLYLHGSNAMEQLERSIEASATQPRLTPNDVWWNVTQIVGAIGDRHASVKPSGSLQWPCETAFPFALAPVGNKAVGVLPARGRGQYDVFDPKYPYVIEVQGIPLAQWIENGLPRFQYAPQAARWSRGLRELGEFGTYASQLKIPVGDTVEVTFSDGKENITRDISMKRRGPRWIGIETPNAPTEYSKAGAEGLFRVLPKGEGYLRIPVMYSRSEFPDFFKLLKRKLDDSSGLTALILDLRGNPGGTRDILAALAPYLVAPGVSPWVANMARVRVSKLEKGEEPLAGMSGRYLFRRDDPRWDAAERRAIDVFAERFTPQWEIDSQRFSEPYYLLLKADTAQVTRRLKIPVYVLINEESFSAASVFAACVKGLPNVTLVGTTTDGSSGRSRRTTLPESGLRIRYSTMISFQRDGRVLDGNGTEPDLPIARDLDQVLGRRDTQLETLLEHIRQQ